MELSASEAAKSLEDEIESFPSSKRMQTFVRIPLAFKQRGLEDRFHVERSSKIDNATVILCRAGLLAIFLGLLLELTSWKSPQEPATCQYIQLGISGFLFLCILFRCMIHMPDYSLPPSAVALLIGGLMLNRYRLAFFTGDDATEVYKTDNEELYSDVMPFGLSAGLVLAFYLIPLRCSWGYTMVIIYPAIHFASLGFLPQGEYEGGLSRRLGIAFRLGILSLMAFLGRASLEYQERVAFLQLNVIYFDFAREKALRFQAEHCKDLGAQKDRSAGMTEIATEPSSSIGHSSIVFGRGISACPSELYVGVKHIGRNENWLIDLGELECATHSIVDRGDFGIVAVGSYFGADVAIKLALAYSGTTEQVLINELRMLRRLRHPNIVGFYGASVLDDSSALLLVEELVHGRSLAVCVADLGSQRRHIFLSRIGGALAYLHSQNPPLIHGNLMPKNILVQNDTYEPKLHDLGFSGLQGQTSRVATESVRWVAPEVSQGAKLICSSDLFSLGRIIYFVFTCREPPSEMDSQPLALPRWVQLEDGTNDTLREFWDGLCTDCQATEPSQRPACAKIVCDRIRAMLSGLQPQERSSSDLQPQVQSPSDLEIQGLQHRNAFQSCGRIAL
eukprot:TRINITY_DN111339_c0_g1_i1.p1 TRINITY_DN111339_c0_g1~~TRINITY_DN111339_c0_g1_i1.p1  ORF type:complete len:619 (+),score=48.09 TRINITY_DN111339_c0_g1_i1:108-1964(+)